MALCAWSVCYGNRNDKNATCYETRHMSRDDSNSTSVLGARLRQRREALGWSQERVGVAIGIDESSSRTRISRYESGIHEPPVAIAMLLAKALKVPLAYLYCVEDELAALLLVLFSLPATERESHVHALVDLLGKARSAT
jgi:transcriptional regulator with XRE-family HTH domain